MTETANVKLAVTVTKNAGRKSGYTATYGEYPRDIWAEGATAAEARANLTAALVAAIDTITTAKPSFARADDGAMWVAVPQYDGGSRHYRVTDVDAWGGTSSSGAASEAFATCVGMTVIPNR
jgi:hypothetical protein